MEKFYLTNNGDILNTEKGYLQTAEGKFIRRVFSREIVYLAETLIPINFPTKMIKEPELPIWEFLWDYVDKDNPQYYHYFCFTRIYNKKRAYFLLCASNSESSNLNIQIVDTDIEKFYLENPNEPQFNNFIPYELINYTTNLSSLENLKTCWALGNPNLKERIRRYNILKKKGIKLPFSYKKRPRKPKKLDFLYDRKY